MSYEFFEDSQLKTPNSKLFHNRGLTPAGDNLVWLRNGAQRIPVVEPVPDFYFRTPDKLAKKIF